MVYEDYITSFEDLLIKDESVSIHHRNIQKVATIMFKVKNNVCQEFVKSLFCQITPRSRSMQYSTDQMLTQSAMENNP